MGCLSLTRGTLCLKRLRSSALGVGGSAGRSWERHRFRSVLVSRRQGRAGARLGNREPRIMNQIWEQGIRHTEAASTRVADCAVTSVIAWYCHRTFFSNTTAQCSLLLCSNLLLLHNSVATWLVPGNTTAW